MVDYRQKLENEKQRLADHVEDGRVDPALADAITYHLDCYDPEKRRKKPPQGEKQWGTSTVSQRASNLRRSALIADDSLLEMDTEGIDQLMDGFLQGTHDGVKDDGYAVSTTRQYQMSARKFLRHCRDDDELPDPVADPDAIFIDEQPDTTVDKADLLTWDEIEALRDACQNTRDRALLELLVNTGQRITAIQTLRIKDIRPDDGNGKFRLNPEAEGLKGADGWRPLLGARAAVRDWLHNHPHKDDPDAYFITNLPAYDQNPDPYEQLPYTSTLGILRRMKRRAGIEKPVNPHNFRHTFVTIAYLEYDLKKDHIRWLIGHDAGSTVMETTYAHLDEADHIRAAERAFDLEDEPEQSTLTPSVCSACGQGLAPDAKACSSCGTVYTPDAQATKQQLDDAIHHDATEASTEQEKADINELRDLVNENPEILDTLKELAGD